MSSLAEAEGEFVVVEAEDGDEPPRRGLGRKLSGSLSSIGGAIASAGKATAGAISHAAIQSVAVVVDRPNERRLATKIGWSTFELLSCDGVTGTGFYLDVNHSRMRRGASLVVWHENSGRNQVWRQDGASGRLQCRHNGLFVDVAGESRAAGAPAITWVNTERLNQKFVMTGTPSPNVVVIRSLMHGFGLGVLARDGGERAYPEPGSCVIVAPLPRDLRVEDEGSLPLASAAGPAALMPTPKDEAASEGGDGEVAARASQRDEGSGADAVQATPAGMAPVPADELPHEPDTRRTWATSAAAPLSSVPPGRGQRVVLATSRWLDDDSEGEGEGDPGAATRRTGGEEAAFGDDGELTAASAVFLCQWKMTPVGPVAPGRD